MRMQETGEEEDFETVIKFQESPQNIRLIPSNPLLDPIGRIIKRPKDIMKVDQNTLVQGWKNFKNDSIDVAPELRDVRRINKKNVIRLQ